MLFQVVPSVLLSMVALITTYMKESDWLLKNFHQSENGLQSYHGEQNWGYHLKEHNKLHKKLVSKVILHFVCGHLSRKQTVRCDFTLVKGERNTWWKSDKDKIVLVTRRCHFLVDPCHPACRQEGSLHQDRPWTRHLRTLEAPTRLHQPQQRSDKLYHWLVV